MFEIEPDSFAGKSDSRAIRALEKYRKFKFDPTFIADLPRIHGGIPIAQYFVTPNGNESRIGRLLTLFDRKSKLQPPEQPSWEFPGTDERKVRSIRTLIDQEGPSCRYLFSGERVIPFAALYRGDLHPDDNSLTQIDCNLVCFDNLYRPVATVVVWHGYAAQDEYMQWESGDLDAEPNYDAFVEPVADSYPDFLNLLAVEPRQTT